MHTERALRDYSRSLFEWSGYSLYLLRHWTLVILPLLRFLSLLGFWNMAPIWSSGHLTEHSLSDSLTGSFSSPHPLVCGAPESGPCLLSVRTCFLGTSLHSLSITAVSIVCIPDDTCKSVCSPDLSLSFRFLPCVPENKT